VAGPRREYPVAGKPKIYITVKLSIDTSACAPRARLPVAEALKKLVAGLVAG
jgi:hypothetical protein